MGNLLPCLNKFRSAEKPLLKDKIILTPENSIVDTLIEPNHSSRSFLSSNQSVTTSFKRDFNWSRIQSIYLGCSTTLDDDINLSLPMVKTVEKLFDVLDENMIGTCKKIYFSTTFLGQKFMDRFEQCGIVTENDAKPRSTSDRMLIHVISYIKLHRLVLFAFESNINEAREILNLIALSHLVMNVSPSDFRLMDIALEKYLLKFKVIDENTITVVLAYFSLITNYICNYIEENKNHCFVNEMLCSDSEEINKRRENLRQLRKWRKLVSKLRQETAMYIEELLNINEKKSNVSEEVSKTFRFNSQCPLSSIRNMTNINSK